MPQPAKRSQRWAMLLAMSRNHLTLAPESPLIISRMRTRRMPNSLISIAKNLGVELVFDDKSVEWLHSHLEPISFQATTHRSLKSNGDLFMNTIIWLAQDEELISIRSKDRLTAAQQCSSQQSPLFWLTILPMPGLRLYTSGGL